MENIRIVIETNAEQASKSFEDLSKSFNDTDKAAVDLRKQIKDLKKDLYSLTPGTEEYTKKLQELGLKMNQLSDTQRQLKAATGGLDTVFQTTTRATADLASGFQAAMGVVTLFGMESENLQKAFVKLQAVMAITNGLRGFAAFTKHAKDAIISIRTYTATLKLATNSTNVFTAAVNKLRIALSSSGVGLAAVALAALATIIMDVNKREEKRLDAMDKLNNATNEAEEETSKYIQTLREYEQTLEELGVIESKRKQASIESVEEQIEAKKEEIKAIEEEIRVQKQLQSQTSEYVSSLGGEFEEYQNLVDIENENNAEMIKSEANIKKNKAAIGELKNELQSLYVELGKSKISEALSGLSDEFKVKMAGGLADQGDYLRAQIKVYQDAYNNLFEIVGGGGTHPARKIKGATEEERKANKGLSTSFAAALAGLQVELDAYNAAIAKKNRDASQKLKEELEKNYEGLISSVKDEASKISEKWNTVLNDLNLEGFITLSKEERSGRLSAQVLRFQDEIGNYLDTWRKLAQKAYDDGKITQKQFNDFNDSLNGVKDELINGLDVKFDTNAISDSVKEAGQTIQNAINEFKLDNDKMREAMNTGLISKEEYQSWLALKFKEYSEIVAQEVKTSNPVEEAFINASKQIIPPEVKTQMESSVHEYYQTLMDAIDKEFEVLEDEFKWRKGMLNSWYEDMNRGWLEGGKNAGYFGFSPRQAYENTVEEANEQYNLLHDEYTKEIDLLQAFVNEHAAILGEDSEIIAAYNKRINTLRDADMAAAAEKQRNTLAAEREFNQKRLQEARDFADAIGGLASAMGNYYSEEAERAKDMYGENSVEYQKYLKKEGNMKIAEVWADAAVGVMAAWASNAKYGLASYVLAGIQTAAILATAAASTLQIKRQTQATASGSGSTAANVSGITDRVIYGNAQSASQQAQLNAEYNQGYTRVFVTTEDISSKQGETKTAVTNNTF